MLQLHMFSRVPQILFFLFFFLNTNLSALLEAHVHDNDLESDGVFTVRDLFFLYWLPVISRLNFKILLLTYKMLNNQGPS